MRPKKRPSGITIPTRSTPFQSGNFSFFRK